jgi:hypothetical protein
VPPAHLGAVCDPRWVPKAVVHQDFRVLAQGSWWGSIPFLESHSIPQGLTAGPHRYFGNGALGPHSGASPKNLPAVWAAHADGALRPPAYSPWAPAAGGTHVCTQEHGLQGAFGPAGGFRLQRREEKSYIRRAEQETKRSLLFLGRALLVLSLHLAPA